MNRYPKPLNLEIVHHTEALLMINIPKSTIAILALLLPFNLSALNLSNTFNKEIKASINSLESYKTYRMGQLEQLKNQGMSPLIYAKEVKRVNNLTQSLPASNLYDLHKMHQEIGIELNALEIELYLSKLK